jgi:hypothetical protein
MRPLRASLGVLLALAALAPAARADDLLLLNGDSATLSGNLQYGLVYIDGDLQLAGDTSITANSIYIGPDANLITCFVATVGDDGCTTGRSLSLQTTGPLTVATGIDLTAGTGTVEPGGNLSLSGSTVAVGGDISTSGSGGGTSGIVSISSPGSVSVGGVTALGAPVSINAGGAIDVGGDLDTNGDPGIASALANREPSGGTVSLNSSGGNVRIDGTINAYGQSAPTAGGLEGGNGASVSITGSDVRTGAIEASGGDSAAATAGASAPINIHARGTLNALGQLDVSGANGGAGAVVPQAGQNITLTGAGALVATDLSADGGQSHGGGAAAGQISLSGASVTANSVSASGGDAPVSPGPGGSGGSITVNAPGGASLGNVSATGGAADGVQPAGSGGSIDVVSASGSIGAGNVQANGGYAPDGPGANGGPIKLSAFGDLAIGGALDSSGSDANGNFDPPWNGGNGGPLVLRAAIGTLSLGGNATSAGGTGGNDPVNGKLGGTGGIGGNVQVITQALGPIVSLSSEGGDGGDYGVDQGPGGAAGSILAWTDAPLFNDQQEVTSDGGNGNPTGQAGQMRQDSSPTAPLIDAATGVLSFTSRSPDADRYQVLRSIAGAPAQPVLVTTHTSGLKPPAPLCEPVTFTVVAIDDAVSWTSDPSPALTYRRQPSAKQTCSQAPHIASAELLRTGSVVAVRVRTTGVGKLEATLAHATHKLAVLTIDLKRAGHETLRLHLPAGRRHGRYVVRVETTSPDGSRHTTTTLTLEIAR